MVDASRRWQTPLPTMYDLPSEFPEELGLPDQFHELQPTLLSITCKPSNYSPEDCLTAQDLNVYYDPHHTLWHKRPDWFMVLGARGGGGGGGTLTSKTSYAGVMSFGKRESLPFWW